MTHHSRVSFFLCAFCVAAVLFSCASSAGTVKNDFFEAENSAHALRQDADRQKYRSYWLQCIKQFMGVYEKDPSGIWAAASLYRAGQLYDELSQHSGKDADKQEAVDVFRRVIKRFPQSAYNEKARQQLREIGIEELPVKRPKYSKTAQSAKGAYGEAESCYQALLADAEKQKYRSYWQDCIDGFYGVYANDPKDAWAAAGLYMAGKLQCELYEHSFREADREEGARFFAKVVREFPQSDYRSKAAAALRKIPAPTAAPPTPPTTMEDVPALASSDVEVASDGRGIVQGLRYWSNKDYTRVVIDADKDLTFSHNKLKSDSTYGKPPRLYVDLANSRLDKELSRKVEVDDNLLKDIRAGQFTEDTVRVVIDIKSFHNYNIFSLNNPFRVVIDVYGEGGPPAVTVADSSEESQAGGPDEEAGKSPPSLADQLNLGVRRIVIDAGHGGRDGGAPGREWGVHEKEVVLSLARKLAEKIRRDLGCEVILTRSEDRFLTLEERTAIANTKNADLFLSVHTNACLSRSAYGIETYFLNMATDEDAMRTAALENQTSQKNIRDLEKILNSLMQNAKINESSRLAGYVQSALCENLDKHYDKIKNKGVKQAPFYVLLGAQMPAILIETGFISNKMECRRLTNDTYQDRVCEGIVDGIRDYINRTKSASFVREQQG